MEPYLASRNNKVLFVFMSTEARNNSTMPDDKFNDKKNKSIEGIFYPFVLPPNKLSNGFWIDKNTKSISFDAEDITMPPGFLNMADYTIKKSLLSYTGVIQDFKPDTVVDVKQYTRLKAMLQEEITESGMVNPSEKIVE
jgi:hypothetical protein